MRKRTTNAVTILNSLVGKDAALREMVARASANAEIAQLIYAARTRAGLTQAQLARLIGTRQPVIARLEDADYRGHSLSMLQRIAAALDQRLELRLVPEKRASAKVKKAA